MTGGTLWPRAQNTVHGKTFFLSEDVCILSTIGCTPLTKTFLFIGLYTMTA